QRVNPVDQLLEHADELEGIGFSEVEVARGKGTEDDAAIGLNRDVRGSPTLRLEDHVAPGDDHLEGEQRDSDGTEMDITVSDADPEVIGIGQVDVDRAAGGADGDVDDWGIGGVDLESNCAAQAEDADLELEAGDARDPCRIHDESASAVIEGSHGEGAGFEVKVQILDAEGEERLQNRIAIRIN